MISNISMNRANVGFKAVMLTANPTLKSKESIAYLFLTDEHLEKAQDAGLTQIGNMCVKINNNQDSDKSVWVKPDLTKTYFKVTKLPQLDALANLVKENDATKDSMDDTIMQDMADDIQEVRDNRSKNYAEQMNRALCSERD